MFTLSVNTLETATLLKKIEPKIQAAEKYLANELEKIAMPYTPYVDGTLLKSLTVYALPKGLYAFNYTAPYAKYVYYGSEDWNWTREFNPLATPYWLERAWNIHIPDLRRNIQRMFFR